MHEIHDPWWIVENDASCLQLVSANQVNKNMILGHGNCIDVRLIYGQYNSLASWTSDCLNQESNLSRLLIT